MKHRVPLPNIKRLQELFEYRKGKLFWRVDGKHGKVRKGDEAGFLNNVDGYRRVGVDGQYYAVHRIIWRLHNPRGRIPFILDHIDGNRGNNAIENLRVVSHSENMLNRRYGAKRNRAGGYNKLEQILNQGESHDRDNIG